MVAAALGFGLMSKRKQKLSKKKMQSMTG